VFFEILLNILFPNLCILSLMTLTPGLLLVLASFTMIMLTISSLF
jgi:hypothetical protein